MNPPGAIYYGTRGNVFTVATALERSATWVTVPFYCTGPVRAAILCYDYMPTGGLPDYLGVEILAKDRAASSYENLQAWVACGSEGTMSEQFGQILWTPDMEDHEATCATVAGYVNPQRRRAPIPPVFRLRFNHQLSGVSTFLYSASLHLL